VPISFEPSSHLYVSVSPSGSFAVQSNVIFFPAVVLNPLEGFVIETVGASFTPVTVTATLSRSLCVVPSVATIVRLNVPK
jgi:hypothetical protein